VDDGEVDDGEVNVRKSATALVLVVFALLLGACSSTPEPAAPQRATTATAASPLQAAASGSLPDLVQRVEPSVVSVQVNGGEGSGVVWNADGTIVTNNHVVEGQQSARIVFADGSRVAGRVTATDPRNDLAIVKAARTGLPAATFADRLPRVGELAVAMGNPLGFENSVTAGIISGVHRAIPGSAAQNPALVDLVQTDAAISPGNSGGALLDADGDVVGINVAYIPPNETGAVSIGFAIPSTTVVNVVDQLLDTGEVRYPFLGVTPQAVTPQIAERLDLGTDEGVIVQSVVRGGPADDAGIEPGDVIVRLAGQDVRTVEDFLVELRDHDPGEDVAVDVLRDGDRRSFDVRLTERPED
jgi:serine protease DegQ